SVCGRNFWPRVGSHPGRDFRNDSAAIPHTRRSRREDLPALRTNASDRRADFLLDGPALDDRYVAPGWSDLARYFPQTVGSNEGCSLNLPRQARSANLLVGAGLAPSGISTI